jgi:hypothetical protein
MRLGWLQDGVFLRFTLQILFDQVKGFLRFLTRVNASLNVTLKHAEK